MIENKNKFKLKYDKIETYEHSDFYIITNNLKYSFNELKSIYKKDGVLKHHLSLIKQN